MLVSGAGTGKKQHLQRAQFLVSTTATARGSSNITTICGCNVSCVQSLAKLLLLALPTGSYGGKIMQI